ncbi:MAG TPA: AAA family ATPase [Verrucomicrobiales bacterium]|nr:AAA family ATPase [Verrucomicrobiales bacterium]
MIDSTLSETAAVAGESALDPAAAHDVFNRLRSELAKVVAGQEQVVGTLMLSLFCQGHCLLVGVPGLAKTLLVRCVAKALGLQFSRIQFTPDLMPGDILGSEILREDGGRIEFDFQTGPVFANLVLADEINRTPPKTQSALLEAMEERRVTVAGETRSLPNPFFVVATQNPIEHEGTYPLPEAQLDRFMFSIEVRYPGRETEMEVVRRTTHGRLPELQAVVSREEILGVEQLIRAMPVADHVLAYAVDLACATRPGEPGAAQTATDYLEWGAGPRASQSLVLGAKAVALMLGRAAPETRDVRRVAASVLSHRIVPNYSATGKDLKAGALVAALVQEVAEPKY